VNVRNYAYAYAYYMLRNTIFTIVLTALIMPQFSSVAAAEPKAKRNVILYGSNGCGICRSFFKRLKKDKISYQFRDANKSEEHNRAMWKYVRQVRKEGRSIRYPVIKMGDAILVSPNYAEFKRAYNLPTPPASKIYR